MEPTRQRTRDWSSPYLSVACHTGAHNQCKEGTPRPPQQSWSVIYGTCTCRWCHPRYEEATTSMTGPVVAITSETVRIGDLIQVGGQSLKVADLVALPHQAKRLRFETGETLTMHDRTWLAAGRLKGRGW